MKCVPLLKPSETALLCGFLQKLFREWYFVCTIKNPLFLRVSGLIGIIASFFRKLYGIKSGPMVFGLTMGFARCCGTTLVPLLYPAYSAKPTMRLS